ncbi:MAG: hypothetical protein PWQ96_1836 [Clostridia bacterium]|jgi:hypothetical protein|nr:hypothetical protein [Clostridiales bacterium]MDK2986192.1 hypothetical protein [Clostridia bacterium]
MQKRLHILRNQRNRLLDEWRSDKKRRIEILAAIMDLDYEISKEMNKELNASNH